MGCLPGVERPGVEPAPRVGHTAAPYCGHVIQRMGLAIGERFGSYEVVELIGVGGMGEVYRARDTRLHLDVALKVLPDTTRFDAASLQRLEREARLLAALNHPNIATLYGLESKGDVHALVMEFVDGETLDDRFSPDGRWIAYMSSLTGRPEVYVRAFPTGEGARARCRRMAAWRRVGGSTAQSSIT
jgi:serine/threonine protein kinase